MTNLSRQMKGRQRTNRAGWRDRKLGTSKSAR
jgi:hypothetical protein